MKNEIFFGVLIKHFRKYLIIPTNCPETREGKNGRQGIAGSANDPAIL
jgi:hypothetical protein